MKHWINNAIVMAALGGTAALAQQAGAPSPASYGNGTPVVSPDTGSSGNMSMPPRVSLQQMLDRAGGSGTIVAEYAPPDPKRVTLERNAIWHVGDPQPKTIKKHDLITIVIREQAEMTTDAKTDLKKDAGIDASITEMMKLNGKSPFLTGGGVGTPPPAIKAAGNRTFIGEGKADRTDSFMTRIAAKVLDVKPNDTFVIEARKKIKHDEEEQEYILTGVCRAGDLTADNSVFSWQIHDVNIEVTHHGAVNSTVSRGWLPKLFDFVNPF